MVDLTLLQSDAIHLYVHISPVQFFFSSGFVSKLQLFASIFTPCAFMQVTLRVLVPFPQDEEHWKLNRKIIIMWVAYITPWFCMPVIVAMVVVTHFLWLWLILRAQCWIFCNWIRIYIYDLFACNISTSVTSTTTFWAWWPFSHFPSTNNKVHYTLLHGKNVNVGGKKLNLIWQIKSNSPKSFWKFSVSIKLHMASYLPVCLSVLVRFTHNCDPVWENHAYVHKTHLFTLLQLSYLLYKLFEFCKLYKQKHLGCKKRRGQSEAAVIWLQMYMYIAILATKNFAHDIRLRPRIS